MADAIGVCRDIMKDIENKFGKTVLHDKVIVGGGSEKFLSTICEKYKNVIEVPEQIKMVWNLYRILMLVT